MNQTRVRSAYHIIRIDTLQNFCAPAGKEDLSLRHKEGKFWIPHVAFIKLFVKPALTYKGIFFVIMSGKRLKSSKDADVRQWLEIHNPKSLGLLDKFLMELRMDRLSRKTVDETNRQSKDRRFAVHKTVELLKHMIGSTQWKTAAELLHLLRGLGRELHAAGGSREPAIGNVVRRTMAAVREEVFREDREETGKTENSGASGGRLSLQSMLWALPQQQSISTSRSRSLSQGGSSSAQQRHESFAETTTSEGSENDFPATYYRERPNLKQSVLEAMAETTSELEDLYRTINEQATNYIRSGEIILTCGRSKTVELFLKAAHAKKRNFQVFVCEGAPRHEGTLLAKSLADAGIDAVTIADSAAFAIASRVNKVLLPAHAVLANGGLVAGSGCNMVALAAKHYSVPTVCVTGMFKLCPMYPHDGQDTLNDLESPAAIISYAEMNDPLYADVEFVNPVHDYIRPELISLYVTNVGSFQPSFIYRLLADFYHTDDWETFD